MEIENIAKIDLYLKIKNGRENLLSIDALIIADSNQQIVNKLKEAAHYLNKIENFDEVDELKQTWKNLFASQLRFSVNRVKEKTKK